MPDEAGATRPPGLLDSLARLGRTLLGVVRTRLEILATELQEERVRFSQLVLLLAAIAFCVQMGLLLLVILLVVLFWDSHPIGTIGALCGLFLVAGLVGLALLRQRLRTHPKLFASTIVELAKDEDRLRGAE